MNDAHHQNKTAIEGLCEALYDFDEQAVRAILGHLLSADAACHFSRPIGYVESSHLYDAVFSPLRFALPDLERRDMICIAGSDHDKAAWVGCAGHYIGNFKTPF